MKQRAFLASQISEIWLANKTAGYSIGFVFASATVITGLGYVIKGI